MLTDVLLAVVIVLLIVLIVLVVSRSRPQQRDLELALTSSWTRSGISETLGKLQQYADDVRNSHRALEDMLRVPANRGALGEMALEAILQDQLPPEMFGIRKRMENGKIPDAHILTQNGIICIDSKFPLENYIALSRSGNGKERYHNAFLRDVRGHLEKIEQDYVRPTEGTAEFAFAYIPSEGVYWYLVNECHDLLREFTKRGVQVVSPLTLSHKIQLIKAGVTARRLSDQAEAVRREIVEIAGSFDELHEKWRVFNTHFGNMRKKAEEVNEAYQKLKQRFENITQNFQ